MNKEEEEKKEGREGVKDLKEEAVLHARGRRKEKKKSRLLGTSHDKVKECGVT